MDDLVFPGYALGRMLQRDITEDDVYLTVEDADDESNATMVGRSTPG